MASLSFDTYLNKPYKRWGWMISGSFLLYLSWPSSGTVLLVFVSLIPLLVLEDFYFRNEKSYSKFSFLLDAFLYFFLFHLLAGFWMYSSTFAGSLMAHLINSSLMALVCLAFHWIHRLLKSKLVYILFPLLWLGFEKLHNEWVLAWPWFSLGNVFAEQTDWIQWYQFTGVSGGSLWLILVNLTLFLGMISPKKTIFRFAAPLFLMLIPIGMSYTWFSGKDIVQMSKTVHIAGVQPNIDSYNEKFVESAEEQIVKMMQIATDASPVENTLFVFPETAISYMMPTSSIPSHPWFHDFLNLLDSLQRAAVFTGAKMFTPTDTENSYAFFDDSLGWYHLHNSVIFYDTKTTTQLYHKIKLLPLVENLPFRQFFSFFQNDVEAAGGLFGSYSGSEDVVIFRSEALGIDIRPVICFESVFGEFVSEQPGGINPLLVIVTNDGWWNSSQGHLQHLAYSRLRAIENQQYVVRIANNGISAIIDPYGKIARQLPYGKSGVLQAEIPIVEKPSFFQKWGDVTGWVSFYLSIIAIGGGLIFEACRLIQDVYGNKKLHKNTAG